MTDHVFIAPPGWPQPPLGWTPPTGWEPDPLWPPAPAGWQFWRPRPPVPRTVPDPPERTGSSLFGRRRELPSEVEALQAENERLTRESVALRAEVKRLTGAVESSNAELRRVLGADPAKVRAEMVQLLRDRDAAAAEAQRARNAAAEARQRLVVVRETAPR